MKTSRNLNSALTLVEVLVSVVLLGLGFAGFITAFSTGIMSTYNARHHIQALNIAKQKIEELKFLGYNGIINDADTILIGTGPFSVTIDDGGTPNEDYNFNGILDVELDEAGNPISGSGEDTNGNGELDTNTGDDMLGQLTITIGTKINLEGSNDPYDDSLPVTVTMTWTRTAGSEETEETETIQALIVREGVT